MEGLPIRKIGEYTPETPREHRETLKHLIVKFEEPPAPAESRETHPVHELFDQLRSQLAEKYTDPARAPGVSRFVLLQDAETLARALGFAEGGRVAELTGGERLTLDDRGQLVFEDARGAQVLMRQAPSGPQIVSLYQGVRVPGEV